jgi:hypothetical protein
MYADLVRKNLLITYSQVAGVYMYTSNLLSNPLTTTIRDIVGKRRFCVDTAYYSEGFECEDGYRKLRWETMVFPYDDEGLEWGDELACVRCESADEAIRQHIQLVVEFSAHL